MNAYAITTADIDTVATFATDGDDIEFTCIECAAFCNMCNDTIDHCPEAVIASSDTLRGLNYPADEPGATPAVRCGGCDTEIGMIYLGDVEADSGIPSRAARGE